MSSVLGRLGRIGIVLIIMGCQGVAPGFAGTGKGSVHQEVGIESVQTQKRVAGGQYLNVEGTLKEIQGDMYVLEGAGSDKPMLVHVGGDTAFPNGQKEPGEAVQALIVTSTGHALIIR